MTSEKNSRSAMSREGLAAAPIGGDSIRVAARRFRATLFVAGLFGLTLLAIGFIALRQGNRANNAIDSSGPINASATRAKPGLEYSEASTIQRSLVASTQSSERSTAASTELAGARDPQAEPIVDTVAVEFAMFDFYQHIENPKKAAECTLVNPSAKELGTDRMQEFSRAVKDACNIVRGADEECKKTMWEFVNNKRESYLPVPLNEKYGDLRKRIERENPEGAQLFHTTDAEGREVYLVVNWGDSPEFDAARIVAGDRKLEVLKKLKSFFE